MEQETQALITRDFEMELEAEQVLTEAELLDAFAQHIAYLIDCRLEFLLSLMYRLDVAESKVSAALSPFAEEPANVALARLVLERQKQRVFTKQHYKQPNADSWDWEE